ncbi:phytoene desaturase family protein [Williamsia deligens]|uniref:Phytoene desaturase family protein n=1 Tax=Williamsia deligens TaxID=321325 RepID=A0ABW3G8V9_9NOCA|nr:NAD(P)/FAD-dependent oxidoreductase [Williamsia deligens]MCP2192613.1 Phytoene dehydrogenase-related protein [Williamsia deligens]
MTTATVVGSGPNGLAAAVTLARAGVSVTVLEMADRIGGGTRTSELTVPGVLHDDCSAVHPMGAASAFFRSAGLEQYGLRWLSAPIDVVHPLDGRRAGILHTSLVDTATGLGPDGARWRRVFAPLTESFDKLAAEFFQPITHIPRHMVSMAWFGPTALSPATLTASRFRTDEARALFGGVAAHAVYPLTRPTTSAIGAMMIAAGHNHGWPVAEGGSQAITTAMATLLADLGGTVHTGVRVTRLDEVVGDDIVMLDLSPTAVADLAGDRLPSRVERAYRRYRYGPGAFKLDIAVDGGIPWATEAACSAGTVHVCGSFEQVVAAERDVHRGIMPQRPFVLLAQQYLADPSRSAGSIHPIWAYAHTPHGYTGDATELILEQIERFAPGFRERIVAIHSRTPTEMPSYNPNYVGGDIITGLNSPRQVLMRPRAAFDPYTTGIDGVYICSAATPPGGGVHGMNGHNAAVSALRRVAA